MKKDLSGKLLRLGIFVVSGMILFISGIYIVGKFRNGFGQTFKIYTDFTNAAGLQEGNNVMLSGLYVGTVSAITMTERNRILVELSVDTDIKKFITTDAVAIISGEGIMGNKIINIIPGKNGLHPVSEGGRIKSREPFKPDDFFSDINGTSANVKEITENLNHYLTGNGTLGTIVTDTVAANRLKAILLNLEKSSVLFNELLAETKKGMDGLVGTARDSLFENIALAGKNTVRLTEELNDLVKKLSDGDGTLPVLLNDSLIASDLKATLANVKAGSEGLNEIIGAAKKNYFIRKHLKKKDSHNSTGKEKFIDDDNQKGQARKDR